MKVCHWGDNASLRNHILKKFPIQNVQKNKKQYGFGCLLDAENKSLLLKC